MSPGIFEWEPEGTVRKGPATHETGGRGRDSSQRAFENQAKEWDLDLKTKGSFGSRDGENSISTLHIFLLSDARMASTKLRISPYQQPFPGQTFHWFNLVTKASNVACRHHSLEDPSFRPLLPPPPNCTLWPFVLSSFPHFALKALLLFTAARKDISSAPWRQILQLIIDGPAAHRVPSSQEGFLKYSQGKWKNILGSSLAAERKTNWGRIEAGKAWSRELSWDSAAPVWGQWVWRDGDSECAEMGTNLRNSEKIHQELQNLHQAESVPTFTFYLLDLALPSPYPFYMPIVPSFWPISLRLFLFPPVCFWPPILSNGCIPSKAQDH